ncbi:MAG: phosphoserine phosphatase SerB [Hyphomicrobiaceae bacterium]
MARPKPSTMQSKMDDLVLVAIAATGSRALDEAAASRLARAAGASSDARWLASRTALELSLTGAGAGEADGPGQEGKRLAAAREALAGRPVDLALVPAGNRRKRLLVADMDSTIIGQECIDEVGDVAGFGAEIAAITERSMRGEIDFEAALRNRVGLLKGLPVTALEQVMTERIRLNPGARTLVATMAGHGAVTALVSGGFTFFTERVARLAGFQINEANRLIETEGRLTGEVGEPVLDRDAKRRSLVRIASAHGLPLGLAIAVGDGANDRAMIEAAGLGVAYRAKPVLRAVADVAIEHADLTALLYLQGYTEDMLRD